MVKLNNISNFYTGECVLITGGTGFLGKVIIEKLLYSCPEIDRIFMLIRNKNGVSYNERMKDFFTDPLFERLKDEMPQSMDKLVPISGDLNSPHLGLSAHHKEMLINKVSVVIHGAASTRFDLPLKETWNINTQGTQMILTFSQKMKRVKAFVYISTAYSNTDREIIEETLCPPPSDINEVCRLLGQDLTEEETLRILNGRPNSYLYTKAFAEHIVAKNQEYMPTIIIRPSIVTAIKNYPVKGWLSNWFGATGLTVFTAKGLNRVLYGKESVVVDLIPVDFVANLTIVAAVRGTSLKELKIYNCCSSDSNPVTLGKLMKTFNEDVIKNKTYLMPFPSFYFFTENKLLMEVIKLLLQVTPACVMDMYRKILGKPSMFMKLQAQAIKTQTALQYFTSRSWTMKTDNSRALFSSLSPEEKSIFYFDPTSIDWDQYLLDYSSGVRQFLEKKK